MYAYPTSINCMVRTPAHKMDKPAHGRRLVARRAELGLSLARVEALTNGVVYDQLLFRLENGKIEPTNLKLSQRLALAGVLGWTPEQLDEALGLFSARMSTESNLTAEITRTGPGDRLRKLREDRRLERETVAGMSRGAITPRRLANLEERDGAWQKVTKAEAEGLALAFGLKEYEFLDTVNGTPYALKPNIYTDEVTYEGRINENTTRLIPVYDLVGMGPGGRGNAEIVEYIDIPIEWKGEYAGYRTHGDSMSPRINDGDIVVAKMQDYASPKNVIVAYVPSEGMVCKYLQEIAEDGTYRLESFNPAYPTIWTKEIKIYGIVRQARQDFEIINGNH